MNFLTFLVLWCLLILSTTKNFAQQAYHQTLSLNDLSAFRNPGKNWVIASGATADFTRPGDMKAVQGKGAVVNINSKQNNSHLVTKEEMGDLELELDFMMAKNSNSGVYLQGRY